MSQKTIVLIVFVLVVICFADWIGEMRGQAKSRATISRLQTKLTKTEVELANTSDVNKANCRYLDLVEKERDQLRQDLKEAEAQRDVVVRTLSALFEEIDR